MLAQVLFQITLTQSLRTNIIRYVFIKLLKEKYLFLFYKNNTEALSSPDIRCIKYMLLISKLPEGHRLSYPCSFVMVMAENLVYKKLYYISLKKKKNCENPPSHL